MTPERDSFRLCAQARLRVGKRLKQLQSGRKQLLARLHGLANPTPEVYDQAIEASAALQANMQAHSKVGAGSRSDEDILQKLEAAF